MNKLNTHAAVLTLAGLLSVPTAFAAGEAQPDPMPQHIGFGSGVLAGTVVGGPLGAIIGGALGGMIGADMLHKSEIERTSTELAQSRAELADAGRRLDSVNRELARKRQEIEQARSQLASLEQNHGQLKGWVEGLRLAVYFDHDSSTVKEPYQAMLNSISERAGRLPAMRIDLEGHSDKSGSADYNLQLSRQRAEEVVEHLTARGVTGGQIVATPRGASDAPADRLYAPQQRRVDLMFRFEEAPRALANTR